MNKHTLRTGLVAVFAASALALTACAGGGTAQPTAEAGGLIPVKVVLSPILDFAPYWVAADQGFFEDEGLDVTGDLGGATSSQAVTPLVVSGSYQVGASDIGSSGIAAGKDLPYRSFVTLSTYPTDEATSSIGVIARTDGPQSFADLGAGDTVGVLGLGSVQQAALSQAIDDAGGDSSAVTFQNVPLPSAAELVLNGSLAAAYTVEPFLTPSLADSNLRVIGVPEAEVYPGAPAQTIAATPDWIASDTAVKFSDALATAVEWINDPANADARDQIIADNAGIDLAVVKTLRLPVFSSTLDLDAQNLKDLWTVDQDYGVVSKDVGVDQTIQLPGTPAE